MSLADTLIVMNGGRVEQIGSPSELYRNPASVFDRELAVVLPPGDEEIEGASVWLSLPVQALQSLERIKDIRLEHQLFGAQKDAAHSRPSLQSL